MTCTIAGCDKKARESRQMCAMHLWRQAHGKPMDAPPKKRYGVPFEALYVVDQEGCWLWTGALTTEGYGRFRGRLAHRVSYEIGAGAIPAGRQIDHLCRVRSCVNPDHLEPVSSRVNTLRGQSPSAIVYRTNICRRGHAYTPENAFIRSNGYRICRACVRVRANLTRLARDAEDAALLIDMLEDRR